MQLEKLTERELDNLARIHVELIYTFTNFEIAKGLRARLGDTARFVSPERGVYQVVVSEGVPVPGRPERDPDQRRAYAWGFVANTNDETDGGLVPMAQRDPDHLNPAEGGNKAADDYWK